jgi:cytochrome bd ubiquinol oxidase subunit I
MSALDLARWQFAITTLYHFIFVPVTLGLSWVVAIFHTKYVQTRSPAWRALTRLWGKLFLINVAMGVVTGIVQEFQFGMNWSSYSRYVGDIFGAPLAMEALIAFFLESTFLGVWIFGWDRLTPKLHLATIYLTALGTTLSAAFILAANSWMQHPVGYRVNGVTHVAQLTSIWAVLTNSTFLITFVHTMIAAALLAGVLLIAVSCWHYRKGDTGDMFAAPLRIGLVVAFVAAIGAGFSGHVQAQIMTQQQPMKMAAAENLCRTASPASFSLFAVGPCDTSGVDVTMPHFLSILATNTWNGKVEGFTDLQASYQKKYGPGDYKPMIGVTYWTFRLMVGMAFLLGLIALIGLLLWRRGSLETTRWYHRLGFYALILPFAGNFFGWIFTEVGRQPWVVFGLLQTRNAVSPSVPAWTVALSLTAFTLLYGVLAIITGYLMAAVVRGDSHEPGGADSEAVDAELSLATVY